MKTILLGTFVLILSNLCIGQQKKDQNKEWKVIFENEKISFSSHYVDCEIPEEGLSAEYVLLKLTNKSKEKVVVSWFTDTYYNSYCTNCDHNLRDTKREYTLKPNETIIGDCAPGLNIGLKIFSKWLKMDNEKTLSNFEVTDIISNVQQ